MWVFNALRLLAVVTDRLSAAEAAMIAMLIAIAEVAGFNLNGFRLLQVCPFICVEIKSPNKALQQNRDDVGYSLKISWLRSAEGSR